MINYSSEKRPNIDLTVIAGYISRMNMSLHYYILHKLSISEHENIFVQVTEFQNIHLHLMSTQQNNQQVTSTIAFHQSRKSIRKEKRERKKKKNLQENYMLFVKTASNSSSS